ncbi:MAG: toxin-antitoxin system HicB family antitoxin [Ruminococcus sp.]|uniref:toxin-antitoxin system HicB family antitoxin n=1 Tax=Ruminococcus sp. TaxID=41978 RepID=UPI0025CE7896|nr:toxin-antitoxin system HicB family antitoxin [Ruminococcus sp.]MCR5599130.1 toxin-antitoxin system HicB family antitoxin [Ruminococcus sp.]
MSEMNFNLRISEKLNAELIRIAKKEGRSKNKQIEQILKEYVEQYIERENEKAKSKETA